MYRSRQVETALAQTLNDFIAKGPTPEELERGRACCEPTSCAVSNASAVSAARPTCSRRARCSKGDSNCYMKTLERYASATPAAGAGRGETLAVAWRLHARSATAAEIRERGGERGRPQGRPARHGDVSGPDLPGVERAKLSNGLPVIVAARSGAPVVNVALLFDAGYAADLGRKPGTANFAIQPARGRHDSLDTLQIAGRANRSVPNSTPARRSIRRLSASRRCPERLDPHSRCSPTSCEPVLPAEEIERVARNGSPGSSARKRIRRPSPTARAAAALYGDGIRTRYRSPAPAPRPRSRH